MAVTVPGPNKTTLLRRARTAGFTLLELLVVVSLIAVASAGVALALRDGSQTALDRDAQRLAVLLESGRAQSRATGVAVIWQPTATGFVFQGLSSAALPDQWLSTTTRSLGTASLVLGPEPMIEPQEVRLIDASQAASSQAAVARIATDGLRPFLLQSNGPS